MAPYCTFSWLSVGLYTLCICVFLSGKSCGETTTPLHMTTTGSHVTTTVKPDTHDSCGGVLTAVSGVLTSPNYPYPYDNNITCVWILAPVTLNNASLTLTFTNFQVLGYKTYSDYVEIRDGFSSVSPRLGLYYGGTIPPVITSTSGTLWIKFKTDESDAYRGFKATWGNYMLQTTPTDVTTTTPVPITCGGLRTGASGVITSPNYPRLYPNNIECIWRIVGQDPDMIIAVHITHFDTELSINCTFDKLEIKDGGSEVAPILIDWCGKTDNVTHNVTSSSSELWIKFETDGFVAGTGFRIAWELGNCSCCEVLTEEYGVLTSPNYPDSYDHSTNCVWIIAPSGSNTTYLSFTDFNLQQDYGWGCIFDYVEVRDGNSSVSPLVGRYCGDTLPSVITSSSGALWIKFQSDWMLAHKGFRAIWTNHTSNEATTTTTDISNGRDTTSTTTTANPFCGGFLTDDSGVITSPNYPYPYTMYTTCVWLIASTGSNRVNLTFTNFELRDEGSYCSQYNDDSVQVRDGYTSSSPLLGTYCGDTTPNVISSSGQSLLITFTSYGGPGYSRGFRATWGNVTEKGSTTTPRLTRPTTTTTTTTTPDASCRGGVLTAESGVLTSPNYPRSYNHYSYCVWKIQPPGANRIRLTFTAFDLEYDAGCDYDHVEVGDGDSILSARIGRYCGSIIPSPVTSRSGKMWVKFKTDVSGHGAGFRATWEIDDDDDDDSDDDDDTSSGREPSAKSCGGVLTDESGVLTSPNYPLSYDHNTECIWTIQPPGADRIRLTFTAFELEYTSGCGYDYVEVRDGMYSFSTRIGRYCGSTIPSTATAYSGKMWIKFRSDGSTIHPGFRATWGKAVAPPCGGELTNKSGVITSPNYPSSYDPNTQCVWTITASGSNLVYINFTNFRLQSGYSCSRDYLEIRDGADSSSPRIGRYCGYTRPGIGLRSSGNTLWIKFRSDTSDQFIGFKANWEIRCKDYLYGEDCQACGRCAGNSMCDLVTGKCPGACQEWWAGSLCELSIESPLVISETVWITSTTATSVTLQWEPLVTVSTGIAQYYKYRVRYKEQTTASYQDGALVPHGPAPLSYTVTGLKHNTVYEFRLDTYRVLGPYHEQGESFDVLHAKTNCVAPSIPQMTVMSVNGSLDQIGWIVVKYKDIQDLDCGCDSLIDLRVTYRDKTHPDAAVKEADLTSTEVTVRPPKGGDYEVTLVVINNEHLTASSQSIHVNVYEPIASASGSVARLDLNVSIIAGVAIAASMVVIITIAVLVIKRRSKNDRRRHEAMTSAPLGPSASPAIPMYSLVPSSTLMSNGSSEQRYIASPFGVQDIQVNVPLCAMREAPGTDSAGATAGAGNNVPDEKPPEYKDIAHDTSDQSGAERPLLLDYSTSSGANEPPEE